MTDEIIDVNGTALLMSLQCGKNMSTDRESDPMTLAKRRLDAAIATAERRGERRGLERAMGAVRKLLRESYAPKDWRHGVDAAMDELKAIAAQLEEPKP